MCNQGECVWLHLDIIKPVLDHCRKCFAESGYFYCTVPTYPSGQIGFILNRKKNSNNINSEHGIKERLNVPVRKPDAKTDALLSYYTPEIHSASFILPKFAQEVFNDI